MKATVRRWLMRAAFAALVAVATLLYGPRPGTASFCDAPEQPGLCPPFDNGSCLTWCLEHEYFGGGCVGGEQSGCCTCLIR